MAESIPKPKPEKELNDPDLLDLAHYALANAENPMAAFRELELLGIDPRRAVIAINKARGVPEKTHPPKLKPEIIVSPQLLEETIKLVKGFPTTTPIKLAQQLRAGRHDTLDAKTAITAIKKVKEGNTK